MFRGVTVLAWGWVVLAGVAYGAEDQTLLKQRIHDAADLTSLDAEGVKPWHLKVSFDILPGAGRVAESGTIEEWWAGPAKRRVVYASPQFSATELHTKDGNFRTAGAGTTPYLLQLIERGIVRPIAGAAAPEGVKFHLTTRKVREASLDCISLEGAGAAVASTPPFSLPTYCLLRGTELVVSYRFNVQAVTRPQTGTFQGRSVATQLGVFFGAQAVASAR